MGRKIFVSYKHHDQNVRPINGVSVTARDYVNRLEVFLSEHTDHIFKGEKDGESLEGFKDPTIESKLRSKIYDSSVTIILISKGMKALLLKEDDQWIPWEISYSLKEKSKGETTSRPNAMIAAVIPDEFGRYDYFIQENACLSCQCRTFKTGTLFEILHRNMFNKKNPKLSGCSNHLPGDRPHIGDDHSYIYTLKWDDFVLDLEAHFQKALKINQNIEEYELTKEIKKKAVLRHSLGMLNH